jgi:flavodoxin I
MNIKLIYGSDTGNTEIIQQDVVDLLDEHDVSVVDLADIEPSDWDSHEFYILGIPTWYDGDLQSDWEDYFPTFQELDFTGKTFAIFGLGDQIGYAEWFCDGVGILAEVILKNGGKVVGYTDKDKIYDFEKSLALKDENTFYGLCLDEDNQPHETIERLTNWVSKIKNEF